MNRAGQAYSPGAHGNGNTPPGQVCLVRVGTVYVVRDRAQGTGEFVIQMGLSNTQKCWIDTSRRTPAKSC